MGRRRRVGGGPASLAGLKARDAPHSSTAFCKQSWGLFPFLRVSCVLPLTSTAGKVDLLSLKMSGGDVSHLKGVVIVASTPAEGWRHGGTASPNASPTRTPARSLHTQSQSFAPARISMRLVSSPPRNTYSSRPVRSSSGSRTCCPGSCCCRPWRSRPKLSSHSPLQTLRSLVPESPESRSILSPFSERCQIIVKLAQGLARAT